MSRWTKASGCSPKPWMIRQALKDDRPDFPRAQLWACAQHSWKTGTSFGYDAWSVGSMVATLGVVETSTPSQPLSSRRSARRPLLFDAFGALGHRTPSGYPTLATGAHRGRVCDTRSHAPGLRDDAPSRRRTERADDACPYHRTLYVKPGAQTRTLAPAPRRAQRKPPFFCPTSAPRSNRAPPVFTSMSALHAELRRQSPRRTAPSFSFPV